MMRDDFGKICVTVLVGAGAAMMPATTALAGGFSFQLPEHNSGASACASPRSQPAQWIHKVAQTCKFDKRSLRPLPFDLQAGNPEPDKPDGGDTPDAGEPPPPPPPQRTFAYYPPGKLHPKDRRKGRTEDRRVYIPNMIFPLALPKGMHPHMNSQIYGYGGGGWGGKGAAGGSECDARNYDPFLQRDNYCEVRGWKLPLCPSGTGHQGLDIRPPTCSDSKWEAVAVVDGTITRVTRNTTVVLKGNDGTSYYYLHMNPRTIRVKRGSKVRQGAVLGKVSKYMSGRKLTTIHLHFMAKQNVSHRSRIISTYVPIYTSLIAALRKAKGLGPSIDTNGDLVVDANHEIGAKVPTPPPPPPEPPVKPDPPDKPDKPDKPDGPVVEKPTDPVNPGDDLAKRVAALEQELTKLKVDSQRQIEQARGETEAVKSALAESEAKLAAANKRIDEREAVLEQTKQAAQQKEAALRAELDQAATTLETVKAELEEVRKEQEKQGIWERVKSWWQS